MQARSIPLGGLLLAWIAVTALIALNRGIDLLWGVALLIAVATVVAALLPKLQLHGIRVRRLAFPTTAIVGRPESISYEVAASSAWARYGVEIFDRVNGEMSAAPTAFLRSVQGTRAYAFTWTPQARGCWQLSDLVIESRYPLGLTLARRSLAGDAHEITVYPDFVPLRWLPVQNDAHPRFERMVSPRRGGHDEFFGLKPYTPGDERRAIHWRTSARLGELVVKEFEHQQDRQVWIVLDLAESGHAGAGMHGTCEEMIRIAHSVAVKARETEIPVGLVYRVADAILQVPAAADRATYLSIREVLARINKHAQLPLARWAQRFREQLPSGGTWVVFNLGGDADRAVLEAVAQQRAAATLFVEFDTSTYASAAPVAPTRVRTRAISRSIVSTVPHGADLSELFAP